MRGSGRQRGGRRRAAVPRALVAVLGLLGCLGAVAYAAVPRGPAAADAERKPTPAQLPRPKITQHPDKLAVSTTARFAFGGRQRGLRFQCRLDGRAWRACQTPIVFANLAAGKHSFKVRGLDRRGRHGRAARFRWTLLEPQDFSIAPRLEGLSALYPGASPVSLPVVITNPNPVPIHVTALQARATADPPGCASAENLVLYPAGPTSAAPLKVPAGGSVSLPAPGVAAPAIQLRDLPVNQDPCQRARFPLAFSGEARG